jgi:hypothetical protein
VVRLLRLKVVRDTAFPFEDAIQYYTAIENDQELIITRNQQDFKKSKIPVMSAGEFIKSIKKINQLNRDL